jgi:hypothetical protein
VPVRSTTIANGHGRRERRLEISRVSLAGAAGTISNPTRSCCPGAHPAHSPQPEAVVEIGLNPAATPQPSLDTHRWAASTSRRVNRSITIRILETDPLSIQTPVAPAPRWASLVGGWGSVGSIGPTPPLVSARSVLQRGDPETGSNREVRSGSGRARRAPGSRSAFAAGRQGSGARRHPAAPGPRCGSAA